MSYEVRRVRFGSHFLILTISDRRKVVHVLNLRHAASLPQPEALLVQPPD